LLREPSRSRRSFWIPAAETVGMTGLIMVWNHWVGEAGWAAVSLDSIGRNLESPWVFDDDPYWINQFGHPYLGTWSYTAARSAGLGFWEAAPFALAFSTLWEIVGETERPALNDQITTPIGGVVFGEILFRAAGMIRRERGFWRELAAGFVSPPTSFNRAVVGRWEEPPTNPTELVARAGAIAFAKDGGADPLLGEGARLDVGLRLVYGPAGDPDTRLERPFDHFELEASYGAYADPVASLLARGLVLGWTFEGTRGRGLWGIYLGYDLVTPGRFRVSTVHVGLGMAGRLLLAGPLSLDLDLVLSGVPMGAAGWAYPGPDGKGRDYHMGGGVQGVVGARLRAADRAEVGLGVREYLVVGAKDSVGRERVTYLSGSALVRLLGPHALGAEAVLAARSADGVPGEPSVREEGRILRVYYAYAPAAPAPPAPSASDVARR
ncbi:MAG TPA: DUF3943 domain-containing protein, partial [Anaeromyxobacteraceae bacterium]|nr:DUF3943 domain-containing protein [Anaeromyxobacteraceae bacterium]